MELISVNRSCERDKRYLCSDHAWERLWWTLVHLPRVQTTFPFSAGTYPFSRRDLWLGILCKLELESCCVEVCQCVFKSPWRSKLWRVRVLLCRPLRLAWACQWLSGRPLQPSSLSKFYGRRARDSRTGQGPGSGRAPAIRTRGSHSEYFIVTVCQFTVTVPPGRKYSGKSWRATDASSEVMMKFKIFGIMIIFKLSSPTVWNAWAVTWSNASATGSLRPCPLAVS